MPVTRRAQQWPWKVEKIPSGFIVKDANGQSLAYVYADNRQAVSVTPTSGLGG
jgi:hypothetical protein